MKMSIEQGKEKATYNDVTGIFTGSKQLTEFLNTYIYVFTRVGSNPLERLIIDADAFNMTITEYQPDVYPEGTLDL